MFKNISLETAQELLSDIALPLGIAKVPLTYATGRILSKDIIAPHSIPHFAKSAMDGYALIASDTRSVSPHHQIRLEVIEEIRAGFEAEMEVTQGTTIKVMTGAPIPHGADSVVKWEDVHRYEGSLTISHTITPGENIVPIGEDVNQGDVIAVKGTTITPAMTAVFAGLGINRVPVYRKVRIAIFSTGDELIDPTRQIQAGKIYNSSLYGLSAQCKELGATPVDLGIAPDEVDATAARLKKGLEIADIVITTGGASTGDYDIVKDSFRRVGAQILFHGVSIKPGSPMLAAIKNGKFIIGLSGNPAAAMVTFDLIVVPLIKKLMGMKEIFPPKFQGIMVDNFPKSSQGRRFLRARLMREEGRNVVKLTGNQANGVLMSMIDCNVLVDIPAGSPPVVFGQTVSGFLVGRLDQTSEEGFSNTVVPGLAANVIAM
ncbi:MAG TPA: gephyrin-like molybdotransferase Glp [Syntrophomonadaceae bacterium]|nr:gephyrin-like molybdotransferase Glp [Syntrophomonadaceae bacterium]